MLPSPTTLIAQGRSYYNNSFLGKYLPSAAVFEIACHQAVYFSCSKISCKTAEYSIQSIASKTFKDLAFFFILPSNKLLTFKFTVTVLPPLLALCGYKSFYFRIYVITSVILSGLLNGIQNAVKKGHPDVTSLSFKSKNLTQRYDFTQIPKTINTVLLADAQFTSKHLTQIPSHVTHVNLSHYSSPSNFNLGQLPHAETIDLSYCDLTTFDLTTPSPALKKLILKGSILANDTLPDLPDVTVIN